MRVFEIDLALLDPAKVGFSAVIPAGSMAPMGRKRKFVLFGSGRSAAFVFRPLVGVRERRLCQTPHFRDQSAIDRFVGGPVVRLEHRYRRLWVARSPSPCGLRCRKADGQPAMP